MDKMQMAHDFAMKLVGNPNTPLKTMGSIVDASWEYADAMQAELDERNKAEAEQKRKEMRELLNADNTFLEKEGQHFDDVNWQPDWSQAPEWAKWWAADANGWCYWFENKPELMSATWLRLDSSNVELAPSFGYTGNWQDSLRERPE